MLTDTSPVWRLDLAGKEAGRIPLSDAGVNCFLYFYSDVGCPSSSAAVFRRGGGMPDDRHRLPMSLGESRAPCRGSCRRDDCRQSDRRRAQRPAFACVDRQPITNDGKVGATRITLRGGSVGRLAADANRRGHRILWSVAQRADRESAARHISVSVHPDSAERPVRRTSMTCPMRIGTQRRIPLPVKVESSGFGSWALASTHGPASPVDIDAIYEGVTATIPQQPQLAKLIDAHLDGSVLAKPIETGCASFESRLRTAELPGFGTWC